METVLPIGLIAFIFFFVILLIRGIYRFLSKFIKIQTIHSSDNQYILSPEGVSKKNDMEEMDIFGRIPSVLIQHYDSLKNHTISIEKTINEFTYYSEYLYTTSTSSGKNKSTYDSNKALYLIYTRTEQFPFMQLYLHITADNNDSIKSQILKYTIGPLVTFGGILYIIEEGFFEALGALSQAISVNMRVMVGMITILSSFIGSLIRKQLQSKNTIVLENKHLEKLIDVKSNDPIFARQLCNPQFVETLHDTLKQEKLRGWTEIYIDTKQQKVFVKIDYLKKGFSLGSVNKFISLPTLANFTIWNDIGAPKTEEIDKREGIFSQLLKSLKLTHAMRIISAAASVTQEKTTSEGLSDSTQGAEKSRSEKMSKIYRYIKVIGILIFLLYIIPHFINYYKTGDFNEGGTAVPNTTTGTSTLLPLEKGIVSNGSLDDAALEVEVIDS